MIPIQPRLIIGGMMAVIHCMAIYVLFCCGIVLFGLREFVFWGCMVCVNSGSVSMNSMIHTLVLVYGPFQCSVMNVWMPVEEM